MPESAFRRYVALGGATIRTMIEDAERFCRVVVSHDGLVLRCCGFDPGAFLPTDLGVRSAASGVGYASDSGTPTPHSTCR